MEHTEAQDPQKATGSEAAEDGLKRAIEAAYRGAAARDAAPAPAAYLG